MRLSYSNVVSTMCLVALACGTAIAADTLAPSQSSSAQVYVCAKKKGKTKGQMRLVSSKTKCRSDERKTQWAVQGPAGAAGPAGPVEPGLVAFFSAPACPAGWGDYAPAQGRYLVGLPPGGAAEATVGSALGDREERAVGQHGHGVTDPGHRHNIENVSPIIRAGNVTPTRVQGTSGSGGIFNTTLPNQPTLQAISLTQTGLSVNTAGSVGGTPAPYVQLLACKKS